MTDQAHAEFTQRIARLGAGGDDEACGKTGKSLREYFAATSKPALKTVLRVKREDFRQFYVAGT